MTDQRPEAPASTASDAEASILHDIVSRAPLATRDRIPSFLLNLQGLFVAYTSYKNRLLLGVAVIGIAVAIALLLAGARLLEVVLQELDVLAMLGLFMVNWVGNGGILVPIPGARMVGLLMIFQNAVLLPPIEVVGVAGAAMALGLLSYYIAGARATRAYQGGDTETVDDLANQHGLLTQPGDEPPGVSGFISTGLEGPTDVQDAAAGPGAAAASASGSRRRRVVRRFAASWQRALERAQPAVEKHGLSGMFWLCFAPTPLGTAAAFLGGAMGFGFSRYLLASFAAKYLLTLLIVIIAVVLADQASALIRGSQA